MDHWIPLEKGAYLAERAFLVAADHTAVDIDNPVIEVYQGYAGGKQVRGRGFVFNTLLVALLDDNDALDLVVDLGEAFKFRMRSPDLTGGKVFTPGVKSVLRFSPTEPWAPLTERDFEVLLNRLMFR